MKEINNLQNIIENLNLEKETENSMINLLASVHCKLSDLEYKNKTLEKDKEILAIDINTLMKQNHKLKEVIEVSLDIKSRYYD